MAKAKITIYDIAKEAGVSISTVSRVLTGSANVGDAKRKKIEFVIQKYNYKTNPLASGLTGARRYVIGILTADVRNPFYSELFVACEIAADKAGYTLLMADGFDRPKREMRQLDKLINQQLDAFIQLGGAVDSLEPDPAYQKKIRDLAQDMPVVITGKWEVPECFQIIINDKCGIQLAIEHLTELGHRDIRLVGGSQRISGTVEKKYHFIEMLSKRGLPITKDSVILNNNYNDNSGYRSMMEIIATGHIPTAVIGINDSTAIGIIDAITDSGFKVPQDISVIGFDNSNIARVYRPSLTSIDYNYERFGQTIINTVVNAINKKEEPGLKHIEVELIKRCSTGPAPNKIK